MQARSAGAQRALVRKAKATHYLITFHKAVIASTKLQNKASFISIPNYPKWII